MISRTWSRKSIAFAVSVAVLSVYSMVALATPGDRELPVSFRFPVKSPLTAKRRFRVRQFFQTAQLRQRLTAARL